MFYEFEICKSYRIILLLNLLFITQIHCTKKIILNLPWLPRSEDLVGWDRTLASHFYPERLTWYHHRTKLPKRLTRDLPSHQYYQHLHHLRQKWQLRVSSKTTRFRFQVLFHSTHFYFGPAIRAETWIRCTNLLNGKFRHQ